MISKGCSETGAFGHSSNHTFCTQYLRKTLSYGGDLFLKKPSKFYLNFKNEIKLWKNIFGLKDNCGWTSSGNFSQIWEEYLWSAVNILENRPKISYPTKRHDTQLNVFDINGKLA